VKIRGERYCYAIWQVDIEFFRNNILQEQEAGGIPFSLKFEITL
jgi:hypothetical protein